MKRWLKLSIQLHGSFQFIAFFLRSFPISISTFSCFFPCSFLLFLALSAIKPPALQPALPFALVNFLKRPKNRQKSPPFFFFFFFFTLQLFHWATGLSVSERGWEGVKIQLNFSFFFLFKFKFLIMKWNQMN